MVAWSRLLFQQEVLIALNTNGSGGRGAEVTVDASLHQPGDTMQVLYHSSWDPTQLDQLRGSQTVKIQQQNDGRLTVRVDLPPAGMAIMA